MHGESSLREARRQTCSAHDKHLRHPRVAVADDPVVEPEALGQVAQVGALGPQQEVECELLQLPFPLLRWRADLLGLCICEAQRMVIWPSSSAMGVKQARTHIHVLRVPATA